jgi:hypothetical protein
MPMQKSTEYVTKVLSVVGLDRVFQDFSNWGNSEIVVKVAATKPTIVMYSICCPSPSVVCSPVYLDLACLFGNENRDNLSSRKSLDNCFVKGRFK